MQPTHRRKDWGDPIPVSKWFWDHLRDIHGIMGPAFRQPKPGCPDCQRLGMDWN